MFLIFFQKVFEFLLYFGEFCDLYFFLFFDLVLVSFPVFFLNCQFIVLDLWCRVDFLEIGDLYLYFILTFHLPFTDLPHIKWSIFTSSIYQSSVPWTKNTWQQTVFPSVCLNFLEILTVAVVSQLNLTLFTTTREKVFRMLEQLNFKVMSIQLLQRWIWWCFRAPINFLY